MKSKHQNPSVSLGPDSRRTKLIAAIFRLPEFRQELEAAAREITQQATPDATEGTVEGAFERVLYATLRAFGVKFHPRKQVAPDTRRHLGHGRVDSRVGSVIIEYKRPAKLHSPRDIRAATAQLKQYMETLSKDIAGDCYGFLTDGRRYCELRSVGGVILAPTPLSPLRADALLALVQNVVSLDLTALTPANLIKDFCTDRHTGVLFQTARTFYDVLNKTSVPKTQMLRSEWEELFRLAHDDTSQQKRIEDRRRSLSELFSTQIKQPVEEYQAIFSLHTSYAIIVKLMAYRVLSELQFGRALTAYQALLRAHSNALRAGFARLEDGEIFRELGILNLLEGDFFSWYCDPQQWNDQIADAVRAILLVLSRYEQTSAVFGTTEAMDLFRELYEAAVPQPVRASFGEFYTPYWLTSHVLDSVPTTGRWQTLDPCCGSGTFVITAIERIKTQCKGSFKNKLLHEILDRVVAIDLNPLAALTARVNYFLHIADLLPEKIQDLVIPVFLGDASYVPTTTELDGVKCLEYRLKTLRNPIHVIMPHVLVENTAEFVKLMHRYEAAVKSKRLNRAASVLTDVLPSNARTPGIVTCIQDLTSQLVNLEKEGWNGVWARIVTNFLTTAAIGRFDLLIGNPPWVDWKNLPEGYREKIKSLCLDRGLFSGDGRTGGINLNVCALISHVAIENWLLPDGHFAFLMPRELTVQPSYRGWRRLPSRANRYFQHFHDWSKAGHPFSGQKGGPKEDFLTYVIGPKKRKDGVVPVTLYIKRRGDRSKASQWRDLKDAMTHLQTSDLVAGQIIPGSTAFTYAADKSHLSKFAKIAGPCSYIGREGIEFYPQELLLFKFVGKGPKTGTVFLKNVQVTKSKYRIEERTLLLEAKYLFPLSRVRRFSHLNMLMMGSLSHSHIGPIARINPCPPTNLRKSHPNCCDTTWITRT